MTHSLADCRLSKGQQAKARWVRPMQPYTGTTLTAPVSTMAGSIPTWASVLAGGRPSVTLPPPGYPPLPATPLMDVSSHWTSIQDTGMNLLKAAGIGRGLRLQSVPPQQTPPVPGVTGIQQVRPLSVEPPASTSAGGDGVLKTPYRQQIQVPSSDRIIRYQAKRGFSAGGDPRQVSKWRKDQVDSLYGSLTSRGPHELHNGIRILGLEPGPRTYCILLLLCSGWPT